MIPDKVVARLAARAAHESLTREHGASPAARGLAAPRASAAVRKGSVRLGLSVDLPYPIDIARISQDVRQDVTERVAHLTGLDIAEVTLTVARLVPEAGLAPERVR